MNSAQTKWLSWELTANQQSICWPPVTFVMSSHISGAPKCSAQDLQIFWSSGLLKLTIENSDAVQILRSGQSELAPATYSKLSRILNIDFKSLSNWTINLVCYRDRTKMIRYEENYIFMCGSLLFAPRSGSIIQLFVVLGWIAIIV